jgi:hypothetical protein
MNEDRIPEKENTQEGDPRSRWEQQVMKDVIQREGRPWEEIVEYELWKDRDR